MALVTRSRARIPLGPNFRKLLEKIRPTDERSDAAQKYPRLVRDFLEDSDLLATVDPGTRLTGSYGRRIAIHEIKDVDFVVFLNEDYEDLGAERALLDLRTALDALADALEDDLGERPEVDLRDQRRSVRVCFRTADFYLDVVPVRAPDGADDVLLVPDREWTNWQPTACVQYGDRFSELNQGLCEEKLVPLMKLIKHWRYMKLKRNQAKSFWVEAMVVKLMVEEQIAFAGASLADVVATTFAAIRDFCAPYLAQESGTPVVPDPMIPDLNPNVAFNWDRDDFETFMRRIDEACDASADAVATDNATDAIAEWQKVFGDEWFPSTIDEEADQAKAAAAASAISVGTAGAVHISAPPVDVRVVRSRPHVFYGDDEA